MRRGGRRAGREMLLCNLQHRLTRQASQGRRYTAALNAIVHSVSSAELKLAEWRAAASAGRDTYPEEVKLLLICHWRTFAFCGIRSRLREPDLNAGDLAGVIGFAPTGFGGFQDLSCDLPPRRMQAAPSGAVLRL